MRFKPVGRRPERTVRTLKVSTLLLLPVLMGGAETGPACPTPLPPPLPLESPGLYWIFLSSEGWDSPAFRASLEEIHARRRFRSEWLRAVTVEVEPALADRLPLLPGVVGVRPVARLPVVPSPAETPPLPMGEWPGAADDSIYGALAGPLGALDIPAAHELGFTGAGVRVGILDGTFRDTHATLRANPPLATRDFVDLDDSVSPDASDPTEDTSHGTALWSLVAGDLPGVLRGGAPGVEVLLARVRVAGTATHVDEDRWVAGLEWLESQGARVVISGVVFRNFADSEYTLADLDGDSTPATRAADQAASRGVLVLAPVGNDGPGPGSLSSPADGDSVVAVGAMDVRGGPAFFSSQGPTADGRGKPDLFAPGTNVQAAAAPDDQTLQQVAGTEFAAALLGAGSALLVEAYPDRGPTELLEYLASASQPEVGSMVGVPDVASAILFPGGVLPVPLDEVDGGGHLTNLAPQFRWNVPVLSPLGLPVTFHLQLSEDSLFQSVLLSDSVVGTFARRPPHPLPPRRRLFWRLRAESVQGVQRVTEPMGPFSVPAWVTLEVLNEPGGSELVESQPLFRWSTPELLPPAEPLVFDLQIVSDRRMEILESYPGLTETEFRVPSPLPFNVPLRWRIIARHGEESADTVTSAGPFVVTSGAKPPATILYQNFPNPFPDAVQGVTETRIWFDLAEPASVELAVFDLRGRLVRHLIPKRGCPPVELEAGIYGRDGESDEGPCRSFTWDGKDDSDSAVPQGVYLLRLKAGGVVDVRRMVLWR